MQSRLRRSHVHRSGSSDGPRRHGRTTRRKRRPLHPAVLFAPALAVSTALAVPVVVGAHPSAAERLGHDIAAAAPVTTPPATDHDRSGLTVRADRSMRRPPIAKATQRHRRPAHQAVRPQWVRPDVGPLTSGYGYRPSMGDFHPGIDLAGPYGSPIRAASAGRIVFAGPAAGFGQMIRIAHAGGIVTVYGHMSRILRWHGLVRAGEVIALEGSEGHSTGPHLHFEVYVHGQRVDPLPFLRRHGVRI